RREVLDRPFRHLGRVQRARPLPDHLRVGRLSGLSAVLHAIGRFKPGQRSGLLRYTPARAPTLVLVVADEPVMPKNSEMTLTQAGYSVLTMDNPLEALEELKEGLRPDVIVSDVNMPQIDGFEFYNRARSIQELRAVPFIFLTALEDRSSMRKGMTLGAD